MRYFILSTEEENIAVIGLDIPKAADSSSIKACEEQLTNKLKIACEEHFAQDVDIRFIELKNHVGTIRFSAIADMGEDGKEILTIEETWIY